MAQKFLARVLLGVFIFLSVCSAAPTLEAALQEKYRNPQLLHSNNVVVRGLARLYQQRDFKPLWFNGGAPTAAVETVLKTFAQAGQEGLDPQDYAQAQQMMQEATADPSKNLAAEIMMTAKALTYIDDLAGERLNPKHIDKELYLKEKNIDEVQVLNDGMNQDPSGAWLAKRTVNHPEYQFLKRTLAHYKSRQATEHYPLLPAGKSLRKGDQQPAVTTLQAQLEALDILKPGYLAGTLDEPTEQAIKEFQADNHLESDGIVGTKTRETLNSYNLDHRIQQLVVAMERWRWLPEALGERYIQVNIAAFDLKAVEQGAIKLQMPVIIGRAYRHTPVFNSTIDSIRFNPSWHVPRSIAVKDKLKKIQQDPAYLERGNYVLYDASGNRMNPHHVDWHSVNADNFNFRLRQTPGDYNALGKIRFSIKSPFNIYLHSTNETELFAKPERSLSSGCIRVSKPAELAEFVFNDPVAWPLMRLNELMEGTQTRNVALEKAVPVYMTYFTVWEGKEGKAHFGRDIYGQDQKIWQALQERRRRTL
jgi:Uncharacterized protein conserved in bacteria